MASFQITRRNGDVYTVLVDDEDLERVLAAGPWYVLQTKRCHTAYVHNPRKPGEKPVYLHRFLTDAPKGMEVDHVDGNGLDNRRSNLRVCTSSQNKGNVQRRSNNTSGFKGVCWIARYGKWQASVQVEKRRHNLGFFATAEEAHAAYRQAAGEGFGEFANVNGVHEGRREVSR